MVCTLLWNLLLGGTTTACAGDSASDEEPLVLDTASDLVAEPSMDTGTQGVDAADPDIAPIPDITLSQPDTSTFCELGAIDETFRIHTVSWASPTDSGNVFSDFINDKIALEIGGGFVWVLRIKENADGSSQIEIGMGQKQGNTLLFNGPPTKLAANIFQCTAKGGPEVGTQSVMVIPDLILPVRTLAVDAKVAFDLNNVTGQIRGHILRKDAETVTVKLPAGSPKPLDELLIQVGATPSFDSDSDQVPDAWELKIDFTATDR